MESTEFKPVEGFEKYEINAKGQIRVKGKNTPMISMDGGRSIRLTNAKQERKSLIISALVEKAFGIKPEAKTTTKKVVTKKVVLTGNGRVHKKAKAKTTKKATKKTKAKKSETISAPENAPADVKKILALDCMLTIKIWKLHKLGYDTKQICLFIGHKDRTTSTPKAIKRYEAKKSLQAKADKF